MKKRNKSDIAQMIIFIIVAIVPVAFAYIVAVSDAPEWFKFWLLN